MGYLTRVVRLLILTFLLYETTGPVVFAQLPTVAVRILDTIYNVDGSKFRGLIRISPTCVPSNGVISFSNRPLRYCIAPAGSVVTDCDKISRVAGEFDLTLLPTKTGSGTGPAGCKYTFRYTSDEGTSWTAIVDPPSSSSPIALGGISTVSGISATGSTTPFDSINGTGKPDGCVRLVSGKLQVFSGPNCAVIQSPPFEQNCEYTFSSTTSITIPGGTCSIQTRDVVFTCYDASGNFMLCGSGGVDPISYEFKMTWGIPVSGKVVIGLMSGQVPNQGYSFTTPSTTWSIPQSQHGANHNRIIATCTESTLNADGTYHWFFCAPNVNPTTHDITFNFSNPMTGRVALMIK